MQVYDLGTDDVSHSQFDGVDTTKLVFHRVRDIFQCNKTSLRHSKKKTSVPIKRTCVFFELMALPLPHFVVPCLQMPAQLFLLFFEITARHRNMLMKSKLP